MTDSKKKRTKTPVETLVAIEVDTSLYRLTKAKSHNFLSVTISEDQAKKVKERDPSVLKEIVAAVNSENRTLISKIQKKGIKVSCSYGFYETGSLYVKYSGKKNPNK